MQLLARPTTIDLGSSQLFGEGNRNLNRNRDFARISGFVDMVSSMVALFLCVLTITWDWFCREDFPMKDPVLKFVISTFPRNEITRDYEFPEMKPYGIAAQVCLFIVYTCRLLAAYALLSGTRNETPQELKLISCKVWLKTAVILISITTAVLVFGNHSFPHQCLLIAELAFRSLAFYYVMEYILDIKMEKHARKDIMLGLRRSRVYALAGTRSGTRSGTGSGTGVRHQEIRVIYTIDPSNSKGHHDPDQDSYWAVQDNVINMNIDNDQTKGGLGFLQSQSNDLETKVEQKF